MIGCCSQDGWQLLLYPALLWVLFGPLIMLGMGVWCARIPGRARGGRPARPPQSVGSRVIGSFGTPDERPGCPKASTRSVSRACQLLPTLCGASDSP
jgi:hypothetical protein